MAKPAATNARGDIHLEIREGLDKAVGLGRIQPTALFLQSVLENGLKSITIGTL